MAEDTNEHGPITSDDVTDEDVTEENDTVDDDSDDEEVSEEEERSAHGFATGLPRHNKHHRTANSDEE